MPRTYHVAAFALWVGICAAAPEFLWQGFLIFLDHLSWSEIISALVIGTLLAFFVEPALERIKRLSLHAEPHGAWPAFLTLPLSVVFGVIAVCIHEAISGFVAHDAGTHAFAGAVTEVPEWALVPFVVTLSWFAVRLGRTAAIAAGLAASLCVVLIGLAYRWSLQDVLTTAIPSIGLIVAGQWHVANPRRRGAAAGLALMTAGVALAWFLLVGAATLLAAALRLPHDWIYEPGELAIDARFYLGWSLGILFAPHPDAEHRTGIPATPGGASPGDEGTRARRNHYG